jgi:hypothetical protein
LKIVYIAGLIGQQKHNIGKSHDDAGIWSIMYDVGCQNYTVYGDDDIPQAFNFINRQKQSVFLELEG